jgi:hypothetical protein
MTKSLSILETELCNGIGDVKFNGVEAYAPALRDLCVGETVTNGVDSTPFGRR